MPIVEGSPLIDRLFQQHRSKADEKASESVRQEAAGLPTGAREGHGSELASLAVGRADTSTSATVSGSYYDVPTVQPAGTPQLGCLPVNVVSPVTGTCLPQNLNVDPNTVGSFQNGAFAYGVATGLGMDIAVTTNLFVRGEFEYIFFAPVNSIQVSLWSARVGAGVKF